MNLRYTIITIVTFSRVKSEKNRFFLDEKNSRIENCGKKKKPRIRRQIGIRVTCFELQNSV